MSHVLVLAWRSENAPLFSWAHLTGRRRGPGFGRGRVALGPTASPKTQVPVRQLPVRGIGELPAGMCVGGACTACRVPSTVTRMSQTGTWSRCVLRHLWVGSARASPPGELTDGEQHSADSEAGLAFIFPSESPDIQSICKKVTACQGTAR